MLHSTQPFRHYGTPSSGALSSAGHAMSRGGIETHHAVEPVAQSSQASDTSKALVPVAPVAKTSRSAGGDRTRGAEPAFTAHLFATRDGDAQTRTRRMTTPEVSAMRYAEAFMRPADPSLRPGKTLAVY